MVANQDIIGVKTVSDQKSEGVLFHQLQPFISQTSPKASNIHLAHLIYRFIACCHY